MNISRTIYFSFMMLLTTFSWSACAAEEGAPKGENCELASPPANAGEEQNHGVIIRIYPRAKDIGPKYSGCQVTWLPQGEKWVVFSLVVIENGDPIRIYAPMAPPDFPPSTCRYKQGKVVSGDAQKCPSPRFLIHESLAQGCSQRIRDIIAKEGLSGEHPSDCEYE